MLKNFSKKTTKFFILILIIIGGIVFGFFDSHFIKVSAEPDYLIVSLSHIDFGTVFPQEEFIRDFTVKLSDAILNSGSAGEVKYKITENSKPGYPRNLSNFIENQKDLKEPDQDTVENANLKINGESDIDDISDKWFLRFDVPPILGNLPQDYNSGDPIALEQGSHGVDIKIELTEEPIFHPHTWIVDDDGIQCPDPDFNSIAEATIDERVWDGDTISVCQGNYQGNILVEKSLMIKSVEGEDYTFVNGGESPENGFIIQNTSGVSVSGFTIQNFLGSSASGIKLVNVRTSKISYNTIQENYLGISLISSNDNNFTFNKILNNDSGIICFPGISGETSNDNNVSHNTIYGQNGTGILIAAGHNFTNTDWRIAFNKIENSLLNGLEIQNGQNFRIIHNKIYNNNGYGIIISSSNLGPNGNYDISFNKIIGSGQTALDLSSSNNNKIRFNRVYDNFGEGIILKNVSDSELKNDRVTDNGSTGIHLIDGENNLIKSAKIYDNNGYGVLLENSNSNEIIRTKANGNNLSGILLDASNQNLIKRCKAYDNGQYGIGLENGSSENQIIRNKDKDNLIFDFNCWNKIDCCPPKNTLEKNKFGTKSPSDCW